MVKNKLEKLFSKSMKSHSEFWGMKLHNNPLAHQNTPGDYLLSEEGVDCLVTYLDLYLVECKQVTCDAQGKGRLAHKRLKQLHDMLSFDNHSGRHHALFCIGFWDGRWDNSDIYFIPAQVMHEHLLLAEKVSYNREDMQRLFSKYRANISKYRANIKNGVIDLWRMNNPKLI